MGTIQRPFHALRGSWLAPGLRALGPRLCDGGGQISAWPWIWDSRPLGSRILHIRGQPALASSDGAAWHAPRSCRGFRLSRISGNSPASKACTLPAWFGFIFRRVLIPVLPYRVISPDERTPIKPHPSISIDEYAPIRPARPAPRESPRTSTARAPIPKTPADTGSVPIPPTPPASEPSRCAPKAWPGQWAGPGPSRAA